MDSLRDIVRQRTAAAHEALERTPLMRSLAGGEMPERPYRDYLVLQLALHAPLEAALARWVPQDWADLRLRKSGWLREDLRALGTLRSDDPVRPTPGIDSWPQALGVLYVLEGSTLGLQVVHKRLVNARHPALEEAGRFLSGYGPDTGRHWKDFLAHFESAPRAAWPRIAEATDATFAAFLDAFTTAEPDLGTPDRDRPPTAAPRASGHCGTADDGGDPAGH